MRVYLDSSAVIKRVIAERESAGLGRALDEYYSAGEVLVSSSLTWIEVARALRTRLGTGLAEVSTHLDDALSGVAEYPMGPQVVGLARRVSPNALRSLDAVHLASALLLDADLVLTYDDRLAAACRENGLTVGSPSD